MPSEPSRPRRGGVDSSRPCASPLPPFSSHLCYSCPFPPCRAQKTTSCRNGYANIARARGRKLLPSPRRTALSTSKGCEPFETADWVEEPAYTPLDDLTRT